MAKKRTEVEKPSCCQECNHLLREGVVIKCGVDKEMRPDAYAAWVIRVRSPDCPLDKQTG